MTNATNTLGIYEGNLPAGGAAVETETVQITGTIDTNDTTTDSARRRVPHTINAAVPLNRGAVGLGLAVLCSAAFAMTFTL